MRSDLSTSFNNVSTLTSSTPRILRQCRRHDPSAGRTGSAGQPHRVDDRRRLPAPSHNVTPPGHDARATRWYRRPRPPRPALASDARPLGGARVRGDAAPDPGAAGRAAVYDAFIAAFPTPDAMADAGPAAVISAWGRLGYPRRARRSVRRGRRDRATTAGPTTSPSCPASGATPRPRSRRRPTTPTCSASRSNIRRVCERVSRATAHRHATPRPSRSRSRRPLRGRDRSARAHGPRRDACCTARTRGATSARCVERCATRGRAARRDAAPPGPFRRVVPPAARRR